MIGRIQGQLLEADEGSVLVDVGGIAYEVEVTSAALADILASGASVSVYTHFVVREDAQLLFGFASRTERDVFRDLIRISGVGPRLALSLLSGISLGDLAACVERKDVTPLTRVPGIGRKTAERLLVELKDRLSSLPMAAQLPAAPADPRAAAEAEDALVALGYKPAEARRAVAEAASGSAAASAAASAEALVRSALRQIARQPELPG